MKRGLLVVAALAAAAGALVIATIAPAHLTLTPWSDGTIPGVLHIHTNRSDGRSSPDDIAAAAARAGQKFIAFTDHGDGTRPPDPPTYRSGVLCLDGVEVSTTGGHYAALDMPAAPYPLGGEARDVVEDVRRLGGFGIAAHPDSPKSELRWREWTAPFDALELINPDTSWRIGLNTPGWRPRLRLLASLVDYPFRSPETLASLLQHPSEEVLAKWENLMQRRHVVGLAGTDAHAKLTPRNADPGDNRWSLPFPGYETAFRMLSVHVRPDRALTGDATADAALILHALRSGHVFTAIDGIAAPPSFEFSASNARGAARAGDDLAVGGPVTLRVRSNAPPEFTTVVWQDSHVLSTGHHEQDFTVQAPESPAVYWTEILSTGRKRQIAWIISNPIYVRAPESPAKLLLRPPASQSASIFDGTTSGWRVEHDPASQAAVEIGAAPGRELQLRYALANEPSAHPFVTLVNDRPTGLATHDRLAFTIRADRPMRISVQLRAGAPLGERWQRSVYVDTVDQERTVYFDDLTPVDARTWRPTFSDIHDLLFVIDTTNAKPGSSGRVWIKAAALQR